jgi:BlaI family transcriptional regulator, penicillinase repressor
VFRAKRIRKPLSELEHLVLDVMWKRSQSTAEDVRLALAQIHPMKESTARTVLKRIEEKGYIQHHVEGRANVYGVSEPRRNVMIAAVRQIIDRLCSGSVEQLLVGMVDAKLLDERELKRLAEKLTRRKYRSLSEPNGD